jgi:two-component system, OmpR family, sensor kinase
VSIRLRLTLLYSTILALTLIIFSAILYVTQARYTLNIVKNDLEANASQIVLAWLRFHTDWDRRLGPPRQLPTDEAYGEQAQQALQPLIREHVARDAVYVLDVAGVPLDLPMNEQGDPLPISDEGLTELQNGLSWMGIAHAGGTRWLMYNLPVITEVRTGTTVGTITERAVIGIVQLARPLDDRDRALRSMGITLIAGSLATSVIAFGVGWFLAGTTLRPIQRITETALEIGNSQDFSSRVEHKGPNDEIGRLATTFNGMLTRLQGAYQQLAHALEVQRDFVADVSHELRTPLTTIRGNLALMQREPPLPAGEQEEILSDLSAESERMSRLVNDLLTLARADAGQPLPVRPVATADIVDDICRQARVLAPDREILCEMAQPALTVLANDDALRQLLLILADNAIKHGEGTIRVALDANEDKIAISVQDSGPGMPEALQARAFDRFYRGDSSRSTPGFGLGLAIARTLTEAQHGTLTMESQVGVGTAFTIELPSVTRGG